MRTECHAIQSRIIPLILLGTSLSSGACSAARLPTDLSCFLQHMAQIQDCNETYDNEDPAGPFQWDNASAYEACLAAAEASKTACEAGIGEDPRDEAWDRFEDHIEMCLQTFPDDEPEAQQACIASALDTYLDEIEDLLIPPSQGCVSALPASRLGVIQSLTSSPTLINGKYPVSMMTNLQVQAGVSAGGYDASQVACLKRAALVAIYRTRQGVAVQVMAVDADTTDGIAFNIPLVPSRFLGANELTLATLFLDNDGNARFAETAHCTILPSPIQGDWNRDGIKNTQDVADYTDFYNLSKKRADMNEDHNIDQADLSAFLDQFSL